MKREHWGVKWARGGLVAVLSAALPLAACQPRSINDLFGKEEVSKTHAEAATTHVAVLSVAPWDLVASSLQPSFKLTSAGAYSAAVPDTLAIEEKLVEAFLLKVGVGLPQTSTTITETLTKNQSSNSATDALGAVSQSSQQSEDRDLQQTDTTKPGEIPTVTPPTAPLKAADLPGIDVTKTTPAIDPFLHYNAATALFQEAALLDQYIKYAAKRKGYVPFLARMQLSVLPHKRNQPYDIFADLSFYLQEQVSYNGATARSETCKAFFAANTAQPVPEVIPLLATDNVEAALRSRAIDRITQLAFALNLMLHGVGAQVDSGLLRDDLAALVGKDLNSLFTVAKLNSNTMRARIGAANQVATRYMTISQTHNISALLMVPKDYLDACADDPTDPTVTLVTQTNLRHARTGEVLKIVDASAFEKDYQSLLTTWYPEIAGCLSSSSNVVDTALETAILEANFKLFETALSHCKADDAGESNSAGTSQAANTLLGTPTLNPEASNSPLDRGQYGYLWQDLLALIQSYGISQQNFSVPYDRPSVVVPSLPPVQEALMLDNGSSASIQFFGAEKTDATKLNADLQYPNDAVTEHLLASAVSRRDDSLVASFPSPSQWNIALPDSSKKAVFVALWTKGTTQPKCDAAIAAFVGAPADQHLTGCYPVRVQKKIEAPKPPVAIARNATTIQMNNLGLGHVVVGVTSVQEVASIELRVANADFANNQISVVLAPATPMAQATFDLQNLDPGKDVVVIATARDGNGKPMGSDQASFRVAPPASKEKAQASQ